VQQLKPGDRARIVDAPDEFAHFLGQAGHVIPKSALCHEEDVWFRTDSGQFIRGERHHFLKLGDGPAPDLKSR
jgi:hypothetical protein